MTSSMAIVLSSGQVKSQMNMAAGPHNGPDPSSPYIVFIFSYQEFSNCECNKRSHRAMDRLKAKYTTI